MGTSKLNQIIAVEKGIKAQVNRELTDIHHNLQKEPLLSGISRSYTVKVDGEEQLPNESTRVQVKAKEMVGKVNNLMADLFDITINKDLANTQAKADVVVDETLIASNVPVTTLLFLEKQLTDLHTFIKKLPIVSPSENWNYDSAQDCWATDPVLSNRKEKRPRVIVKAKATDKHPEQVEVIQEDQWVGTWKTIKFSGSMKSSEVNQMLERCEKLRRAVKFAREEANSLEVQNTNKDFSKSILGYIFN